MLKALFKVGTMVPVIVSNGTDRAEVHVGRIASIDDKKYQVATPKGVAFAVYTKECEEVAPHFESSTGLLVSAYVHTDGTNVGLDDASTIVVDVTIERAVERAQRLMHVVARKVVKLGNGMDTNGASVCSGEIIKVSSNELTRDDYYIATPNGIAKGKMKDSGVIYSTECMPLNYSDYIKSHYGLDADMYKGAISRSLYIERNFKSDTGAMNVAKESLVKLVNEQEKEMIG